MLFGYYRADRRRSRRQPARADDLHLSLVGHHRPRGDPRDRAPAPARTSARPRTPTCSPGTRRSPTWSPSSSTSSSRGRRARPSRDARATSRKAARLLDLAREFGESTGRGAALRVGRSTSRAHPDAVPRRRPSRTSAGAMLRRRRLRRLPGLLPGAAIADLLRIATGGTGVLPPGGLHPDLVARVADEAVTARRPFPRHGGARFRLPAGGRRRPSATSCAPSSPPTATLYPDDTRRLRAHARRGPAAPRHLPGEGRPRSPTRPWHGRRPGKRAAAWPAATCRSTSRADPLGDPWTSTRRGRLADVCSDGSRRPDDVGSTSERGAARRADSSRWARRTPRRSGLDPTSADRATRHPRRLPAGAPTGSRGPRSSVQFAQRRPDLEEKTPDVSRRPLLRPAPPLIAGVDGRGASIVVAKPLPFTGRRGAAGDHSVPASHHEFGAERLRALRDGSSDRRPRPAERVDRCSRRSSG